MHKEVHACVCKGQAPKKDPPTCLALAALCWGTELQKVVHHMGPAVDTHFEDDIVGPEVSRTTPPLTYM